ncbi:MAG: peptidase dimerization domain-containing protein, partial [Acidobacteria bacterium]|nr:peptidase dimerization domain-containing protein [Candidatus Sulfomarinibacter sp. MAG AM2]
MALRHELHAHAELAGGEVETSRIIRDFLDLHEPDGLVAELGGFGLAAVFEGPEEGPSVMFRTEIDAVPVQECNDVNYRSRRPGVSHTCGHDGHAAIVAGLASRLSRRPIRRGRVLLLFLALHNLPREKFGEIQIKSGPFASGSVGVILRFLGKTSHAAYPEQGESPALAAAQLIQELTVLPDSLGLHDGIARLTVIHARIGEAAFGTTPGEAEVMATLRSDREDVLNRLREAVVDQAQRIAQAHGLEHAHSWTDDFPVTTNHPEAVALVEAAAKAGGVALAWRDEAYPWSEDFGWFTRRFKGALFGLGAGHEAPALHSPEYDFPD